jgi:hypothetical protein
MIHEPCSFLSDAQRPVHLVAADPVLAVGGHPDCGEPLPQVDRAVLEDGSDLGGELATRMLLLAFPQTASRDEARIGAPAYRTTNTARPAKLNHCAERHIRISEIPDGFEKRLGLGEWGGIGFHTYQYDADRPLSQVYYYPN